MALKLATGPAVEPVLVSEAKLHLRIDHASEDTMIGTLITLAREAVEQMTDTALINQTWDYFLDGFWDDELRIPLYPLSSVLSVKYKNSVGTEETLAATNYVVDTASRPGRILWSSSAVVPAVELYRVNAVTVRFTAGFGSSGASVPVRFRQAILLLVGHYYENREAVFAGVGSNVQVLPMGVTALLANDLRRFG